MKVIYYPNVKTWELKLLIFQPVLHGLQDTDI